VSASSHVKDRLGQIQDLQARPLTWQSLVSQPKFVPADLLSKFSRNIRLLFRGEGSEELRMARPT
jgi:hypothetical protein